MGSLMKLACVIVACMAVVGALMARTQAQVTCSTAYRHLTPCFPYVMGGSTGTPPARCCEGVRAVANATRTTVDRQRVCNCLKDAAATFPGLNSMAAQSIPRQCQAEHFPYDFSSSPNCDSIS
ncbi:non-specific lipid-transfer protein 1-like [Senna tora]|uniref:Non-specific lipid-transfer protein n=1 Tax=Senna tora TaxID=362788 RepID=A0A834XK45_9FABA|nr:non-specific lipid-transfer protein 1-like [Senna tora]